MFGALLGIFLAALGFVIIIRLLTEVSGMIAGHLHGPISWRKLGAIQRYWKRYSRPGKWGERLVYGSVFWFFFYCSVAYIMLLF
jgi:hypothetical protein